MFLDETERPIEDQSPLIEFCEYLRGCGHLPYLIPAGASEHRLGSMGYMACAAEIVKQSKALDVHFDYVVHCTGSSSTAGWPGRWLCSDGRENSRHWRLRR